MIAEADIDQRSLLDGLKDFNDRSRAKTEEGKKRKRNTYKSAYALYEGRELVLNVFRSGRFPIKNTKRRIKDIKS